MSKSNGGIGLGTIIFISVIAYGIFSGDDEDKKEVDTKTEDQIVSEKTKEELKESVQEVITSAKKAYEEVKKDFDKQKQDFYKQQKEGEEIDKTQDKQKKEEEVIEKREEEKLETLKPLEENPEEEVKFKRL